MSVLDIIENNKKYLNQNPKCEPQLGKRGLYSAIGGQTDTKKSEMAMLWVLNLSDGNHTLLEISEKSGIEFDVIKKTANTLLEFNLLKEC
ncbi:MAG: winged helix-turn-helix domain-containing protein [Heteroscytonema crispum UTEX LB 1556]